MRDMAVKVDQNHDDLFKQDRRGGDDGGGEDCEDDDEDCVQNKRWQQSSCLSNQFSSARRFRTSRLEAAEKGEVALEVRS